VRFILSGGHTHDGAPALALMADFHVGYVLADKGYDSDAMLAAIEVKGLSRSSRLHATAKSKEHTTRPSIKRVT
jgi:transposase